MDDDERDEKREQIELSLVMPFVVVESKGGPYRDDDWVAGYECGQIASLLERHDVLVGLPLDFPVRTANVPQLDLLAMQHGYSMRAQEWDEGPEWSFVSFSTAATKETQP